MRTTLKSGRAGLARAATAVALAAGLASIVSVQGAGASGASTHSLHTRGLKTATSTSNLIDHHGEILPASKTVLVFWGPSSAWSKDVVTGLQGLFAGFNGSKYLGIAEQYMRGASISSSYTKTYFDSSIPPGKVSPSTLGNEVVKVLGGSANVDTSTLYLVYTSNFPRGGNFCAWHSFASSTNGNFPVAYMPNTTGVAGCDPGNSWNLSGSEGLRSLANVSSHEFMETVTDALPANATYGWIDSSGSEIGDKCAWQFSAPVTVGGTAWQLQEEWSNAVSGCVQGS